MNKKFFLMLYDQISFRSQRQKRMYVLLNVNLIALEDMIDVIELYKKIVLHTFQYK